MSIKDKSFAFAIQTVRLYKYLIKEHKEFVMGKQILRSGTSIGANIREAMCAQSKKDFIHKYSISFKECNETMYWLELLYATDYLSEVEFNSMHEDANEVFKMLSSAIITAKKNVKTKE